MIDLRDVLGTDREGSSGTLFGLSSCALSTDSLAVQKTAVAIVGAPIATPYPGFGLFSASAPEAIRQASAYEAPTLSHHDFDINGSLLDDDYGTIIDTGDLATSETDFAHNRSLITRAVGQILDAGAKPIVIGGDDSVPIPVFQAFAGRGRYTILQIDAHIDWRDDVNGECYGLSSTMRRASEMAEIEQIIQVGMRSPGSARTAEYRDALAWGATIIRAQQVYRQGVEQILDLIPAGSNVLVTFDCDSLDSSAMPAVMSPTPGGLMYWDVVEMLQGVAAKANLCGFNLVEFMPDRDMNGTAAMLAARLIFNAAANMARK